MEMLELNNLHKTFNPGTVNEKVALNGVSLHMEAGDFATIVGSNGAGKSTMFNAITGGFIADEGSIVLGGQDITFAPEYERSKVIGHLFQDPLKGTAPHMTIEENLAVAYLRSSDRHVLFGRVSRRDRDFFRDALAQLDMGLEDRMNTPVGLLSGGQRQALTLLMATLVTPKLLLLDEHTAALVLTNMVAADFAAVHVDCNCSILAGFTLSDNSSLCIPCDLAAIHVERTAAGLTNLYFDAIERTAIERELVASRYCYTTIGFTGIRFQFPFPIHTTVRQLRGAG